MTLALVVVAFFVVGFEFKRRWTLAVPLLLGAVAAAAMAASAHSLNDTPIPFLVVLGTVANAAGLLIRKPMRAG